MVKQKPKPKPVSIMETIKSSTTLSDDTENSSERPKTEQIPATSTTTTTIETDITNNNNNNNINNDSNDTNSSTSSSPITTTAASTILSSGIKQKSNPKRINNNQQQPTKFDILKHQKTNLNENNNSYVNGNNNTESSKLSSHNSPTVSMSQSSESLPDHLSNTSDNDDTFSFPNTNNPLTNNNSNNNTNNNINNINNNNNQFKHLSTINSENSFTNDDIINTNENSNNSSINTSTVISNTLPKQQQQQQQQQQQPPTASSSPSLSRSVSPTGKGIPKTVNFINTDPIIYPITTSNNSPYNNHKHPKTHDYNNQYGNNNSNNKKGTSGNQYSRNLNDNNANNNNDDNDNRESIKLLKTKNLSESDSEQQERKEEDEDNENFEASSGENNDESDDRDDGDKINDDKEGLHRSSSFRMKYNKRRRAVEVEIKNDCVSQLFKLSFYQALGAEFIGTLILVIYGCSFGLPIADPTHQNAPEPINGMLGTGLIVGTLVWGLGSVSGCHINPAVTVALLAVGKVDLIRAIFYIGCQLAGATLGAVFVREMVPNHLKPVQQIIETSKNILLAANTTNNTPLERVARQVFSGNRTRANTTRIAQAILTTKRFAAAAVNRTTTRAAATLPTTLISLVNKNEIANGTTTSSDAQTASPVSLGLTLLDPSLTEAQGYGIEVVTTFILMLTIFACLDSKRKDLNGSFPLTIGLTVAMCSIFAGPYTGCSMNPARSFGPAAVANNYNNHWIYWVGPITGSLIAALIYKCLTHKLNKPKRIE